MTQNGERGTERGQERRKSRERRLSIRKVTGSEAASTEVGGAEARNAEGLREMDEGRGRGGKEARPEAEAPFSAGPYPLFLSQLCVWLFAADGPSPAHFCSFSGFGPTDGRARTPSARAPPPPRAAAAPPPSRPEGQRPGRAESRAAHGDGAGRVRPRGWGTEKRRINRKGRTNPWEGAEGAPKMGAFPRWRGAGPREGAASTCVGRPRPAASSATAGSPGGLTRRPASAAARRPPTSGPEEGLSRAARAPPGGARGAGWGV